MFIQAHLCFYLVQEITEHPLLRKCKGSVVFSCSYLSMCFKSNCLVYQEQKVQRYWDVTWVKELTEPPSGHDMLLLRSTSRLICISSEKRAIWYSHWSCGDLWMTCYLVILQKFSLLIWPTDQIFHTFESVIMDKIGCEMSQKCTGTKGDLWAREWMQTPCDWQRRLLKISQCTEPNAWEGVKNDNQ